MVGRHLLLEGGVLGVGRAGPVEGGVDLVGAGLDGRLALGQLLPALGDVLEGVGVVANATTTAGDDQEVVVIVIVSAIAAAATTTVDVHIGAVLGAIAVGVGAKDNAVNRRRRRGPGRHHGTDGRPHLVPEGGAEVGPHGRVLGHEGGVGLVLGHGPAVVGQVLGEAGGQPLLVPDGLGEGLAPLGDGGGLGRDLPGLLLGQGRVGPEGEEGGVEGVGHGGCLALLVVMVVMVQCSLKVGRLAVQVGRHRQVFVVVAWLRGVGRASRASWSF